MTSGWPTGAWRGRWIWDPAMEKPNGHSVYLRRVFTVGDTSGPVMARVACDSRYALFVGGELVGRGPIRSVAEFAYWDEHDLAPYLRPGANVVVALCLFQIWRERDLYGATLGQGSFCLETAPDSPVELLTDASWSAVPTPWATAGSRDEVVDGRRAPAGVHDPGVAGEAWPSAVVVTAAGSESAGPHPDRPPAPPYVVVAPRPIPPLTARRIELRWTAAEPARATAADAARPWRQTVEIDEAGDRRVTVWDAGANTYGYVRLRVRAEARHAGETIDLMTAETLGADGLPARQPLNWNLRYQLAGTGEETIGFLQPMALRYVAAVGPPDLDNELEVAESIFPRPAGAAFACDDARFSKMWAIGARTVDLCASDAFVDGSREDQAWVGDAGVEIPIHLVTSPDTSLVRRTLQLGAESRRRDGLLSATAPDETQAGNNIPDFSLHWIRSLARYWAYSGDETFVRAQLPVADGIVERYESYRGASDLLEDVPGWVFIDWAQIHRDTVIGAHDGLYAAALRDYATLPGAADVEARLAEIADAFQALWDPERQVYVDALGAAGRSRRISQHTNGAALLADLVPAERVAAVAARITNPELLGGRLVPSGVAPDATTWQLQMPQDFDPEVDVLDAQPFFAHIVHAGLARHGHRDLVLDSLARWADPDWMWTDNGTFPEHSSWVPGHEGGGDTCHGWSATPTYDLTTYFLGLSPAEPGYGRARLDPYLGPLAWISGTVPTPHGWLTARVARDTVDLTVPAGVEVLFGGQTVGAGQHRLEGALSNGR